MDLKLIILANCKMELNRKIRSDFPYCKMEFAHTQTAKGEQSLWTAMITTQ